MNRRLVIMILVAIIMAGGAALVANSWLQDQLAIGSSSRQGLVAVAAAAIDIPYGQKLELAHIKMIELPASSIPAGAYRVRADVVGLIAGQSIISGEVLLAGRVVENLGGSTLAAVISPGMRAVAVRVNEIIGVAGFLLPGNRVDILASKSGSNRTVSISTILHDIKVLAVDQTSSTDKNEPVIVRAVTLEVTPQQAEKLVKATVEGSVQLALRNPGDDAPLLVAVQEAGAVPVVAKPVKRDYSPPRVMMIRGTTVSMTELNR